MSDAKAFAENWAAEMRWRLWGEFDLRYKAIRLREKIVMKIAWALPREIAYWATIRVWANATQGQWGMESPLEMRVDVALDRWVGSW